MPKLLISVHSTTAMLFNTSPMDYLHMSLQTAVTNDHDTGNIVV